MLNIIDTENINVLEFSQGCISTNADYLDCQKRSFNNILMVKTIDTNPFNYNFIKKYNDIFMLNAARKSNKIERISSSGKKLRYFFDTALSMAYRCSCILDKYYELNSPICNKIVDNITTYFDHNSGVNQKLFKNNWKDINGYTTLALFQQSIGQTTNLTTAVLNNINLFRFISCVGLNICDFSNIRKSFLGSLLTKDPNTRLPSPFYSDFKLRVVLNDMEYLDPITNATNNVKSVEISLSGHNTIHGKFNSFQFIVDPKNDIRDEIINNIRGTFKRNFEDILNDFENPYIDDTYPIIFIPCSYRYECNIAGKANTFDHAISMLYIKNKKRLYFYESQVVSDDDIKGMIELVGALSTVTKEIIKNRTNDNSSVKKYVHELHRYKDPDTDESLYSKIQREEADDTTGGLCVLLSHLPLYGSMLLPTLDGTLIDSEEYIRFFVFMFTFYSIKIRTEQRLKNDTNPVITNISVIFPYLFTGVYQMIKNFNDYKATHRMSLYRIDKDIEQELENDTKKLIENIEKIKGNLHNVFYQNTNELSYDLSRHLGTNIFRMKRN